MNSRGFSLVSAMIASAIVGVVIAGFAQFMASQHHNMMGINQKFESLKVQQILVRTMADPLSCSCLMNSQNSGQSIQFNVADAKSASNLPSFALNKVFSSCKKGAAPGSGPVLAEVGQYIDRVNHRNALYVSDIRLKDITHMQDDQFKADLTVSFGQHDDPAGLSPGLSGFIRPASSSVIFTADSSGAVKDCLGANLEIAFDETIREITQDVQQVISNGEQQTNSFVNGVDTRTLAFRQELQREADRVVSETEERLRILSSTPPPEQPPQTDDPPTGIPRLASVNDASINGNKKLDVKILNSSVDGNTGWEVRVIAENGKVMQASTPKSSNQHTVVSVITSSMASGSRVRVVAIGTNSGGRSGRSQEWDFFAP